MVPFASERLLARLNPCIIRLMSSGSGASFAAPRPAAGTFIVLGRVILGLGLLGVVLTLIFVAWVWLFAPPCPAGRICEGTGLFTFVGVLVLLPGCLVVCVAGTALLVVGRVRDRNRTIGMQWRLSRARTPSGSSGSLLAGGKSLHR